MVKSLGTCWLFCALISCRESPPTTANPAPTAAVKQPDFGLRTAYAATEFLPMDAGGFANLFLASMTTRRFEPLCFGRRDGFDFYLLDHGGKIELIKVPSEQSLMAGRPLPDFAPETAGAKSLPSDIGRC